MLPVLLVDDDPDDALLVRRAFVRHHLANPLDVVLTGPEALAWLDNSHTPACILLDLHLPGMSGLELLRVIRQDPRRALLRIIAFTSDADESLVVEAWRAGINSYLRKPLDGERFMHAIGQVGQYWCTVNELPPRR